MWCKYNRNSSCLLQLMHQLHAHNSNYLFLKLIILEMTINGSLEITLVQDIHEMGLEVEKS